ncbi:MAG TPA: LamG-like jellyroll fold domain-containing protein [Cytophagales bacterium]|nr:LamG-like jellyroll fold domain-containing protein [Cytophagales bacterium]
MKTLLRKSIFYFIAALLFAGAIGACSDDDGGKVSVDKQVLTDSITAASTLVANTEEGPAEGQYTVGSKATLQAAITAAESVKNDVDATQAEVNSAVVSLSNAIAAYRDQKVLPIAPEALIGFWSFDEGTGTTATDESGNGFDGAFKTGHADWGAGTPVWTADRYGNANKALQFDKGANIEIPYNSALNPANMTIALWVNTAEIRENNRFIGLHSWNGYKFQLQSTNRPFYTVNVGSTIYDRDAEVALPLDEWHHIAVTFGGGETVFYIDGTAVKAWADTPGEALSISGNPFNLVFGQDFPTDKYAATDANYENDKLIPLAWGGYFHGSMDEIRIYKSVLSGTQITSLYNQEKP